MDFSTPMGVVTQLVGFAAMALCIISFQAKKRNTILLLQIFSACLWTTQFFLLGTYTGAAINFIAIPRNILFSFRGKYKWADSIALPIGISLLFQIAGILTYQSPIDLLPMAAMAISTFALFARKPRTIRLMTLAYSPLWGIYDGLAGSLAGVLNELLSCLSVALALYRFRGQQD